MKRITKRPSGTKNAIVVAATARQHWEDDIVASYVVMAMSVAAKAVRATKETVEPLVKRAQEEL